MFVKFIQARWKVLSIGFLIGVFLEVQLIGRHSWQNSTVTNAKWQQGSAAKKTWLSKCRHHAVVKFVHKKKLTEKQECQFLPGKPQTGEELCQQEKESWQTIVGDSSWSCLCEAFQMLTPQTFDWLFISPDNLIAILENLKYFLSDYEPWGQYYFGYSITTHAADFNILSAGIVLSNGAFQKLMQKFSDKTACRQSAKYWNNEDMYLGQHLASVGIEVADTRDAEGGGRFHGYNVHNLLEHGKLFLKTDYARKAKFGVKEGKSCCSPRLITLSPSDPDQMYYYYFAMNKLLPNRKPLEEVIGKEKEFSWEKFLRDEGYSEQQIQSMSPEEYYKIWEKKLPPHELYAKMREHFGS